jgi:hypothetical protein
VLRALCRNLWAHIWGEGRRFRGVSNYGEWACILEDWESMAGGWRIRRRVLGISHGERCRDGLLVSLR